MLLLGDVSSFVALGCTTLIPLYHKSKHIHEFIFSDNTGSFLIDESKERHHILVRETQLHPFDSEEELALCHAIRVL